MLRTYKYRLYPSRSQTTNLWRVLDACRGLYNMALAERKYAYQLESRRVSNAELYEVGKHYRQTFPYADQVFSQTAQSVIEQVDLAFQGFFRRVKAGEKPGYPRFKGRHRFNSFLFKQFGMGARLSGRRLKLFGWAECGYGGTVRWKATSRRCALSTERAVGMPVSSVKLKILPLCLLRGKPSGSTSVFQRSSRPVRASRWSRPPSTALGSSASECCGANWHAP